MMSYFLACDGIAHSIITAVERAKSSTGVQARSLRIFSREGYSRTYYELLGVERNKYAKISELLCLDLSRFVHLSMFT